MKMGGLIPPILFCILNFTQKHRITLEPFLEIIKLFISLAALIFFAERLINASVSLAKAFGVSSTVIGLTLLAYGTSLPEFAVSSIASIKGHSDISVANIIGSNIYNIAVVMGLASIINPIALKDKKLAKRDGIFMLIAVFFLFFLSYIGGIGRVYGIFMLAAIICYTYYILKYDTYEKNEKEDDGHKIKTFLQCGILLLCVLVSGSFTVDSAAKTASFLGIREWVIGATIVAAGTSLPETVVSMIAARKGEFGMSVGNIVGSNIFNILWVLGFASLLNPLTINVNAVSVDLFILFLVSVFFFVGLYKGMLTRIQGMFYLLTYVGYIYYLVGF